MQRWPIFLLIITLASLFAACGPAGSQAMASAGAAITPDDLASCPVTRSSDPPFIPPPSYRQDGPSSDQFWYGTDSLWTALPEGGVWSALPHNPEGYTQKLFWWRKGYSWREEPEPKLAVTGRRLDAPAPPLKASKATNAFAEDIQSAMLVGVDFPAPGCWEISGSYAGSNLSFVVFVAP